MDRQKALDILFMSLGATARRISATYGTLGEGEDDGNQLEGTDLIREACDVLSISQDDFYQMQRDYLELKGDLYGALGKWVNREFKKKFNCSAPTFSEILNRV